MQDVPLATAWMLGSDALCIFLSVLYFTLISKHWKYLFGISLLLSAANFINFFFLPESPKFYHGRGDFEKTRKILTFIARKN